MLLFIHTLDCLISLDPAVGMGKLYLFFNYIPKAFLSMPTDIDFCVIMMIRAVDSLCSALAGGGFCIICLSLTELCFEK